MITLQMKFVVASENRPAFEEMIAGIYGPALERQDGFVNHRLLRQWTEAERDAIAATAGDRYDYQFEFTFATEEQRIRWAASADHDVAFAAANALADAIVHNGYDLVLDSTLPAAG
jgi:heme-degrading monooxygenase HmoA